MIDRKAAVDLVQAMIDSWEHGVEASQNAIRELTTDDFVWRNSGYPDVSGHDAACALWQGAVDAQGLGSIETEIVRMAVDLPVVTVERVDHMKHRDGHFIATLPIVGVFELRGDKIAYWADYTDPSPFRETEG